MASGKLKPHKNGGYTIHLDFGFDSDGVRDRRQVRAEDQAGRPLNQKESRELMYYLLSRPEEAPLKGRRGKEKQKKALESQLAAPKDYTLAEYAKRYIDLGSARKTIGPNTRIGYLNILENHVSPSALGDLPLRRITAADLDDFYHKQLTQGRTLKNGRRQKLSGRTVLSHHIFISSVLKAAVEDDLIEKNPAAKAHPPEAKKVIKPIMNVPEEGVATDFFDFLSEKPQYPFFALDFVTGIRRSELAALSEDCVRKDSIIIDQALFRPSAKRREDIGTSWIDDFLAHSSRYSVAQLEELWGLGFFLKPPKSVKSEREIPITPTTYALLKRVIAKNKKNRLAAGGAYHDFKFLFCHDDGSPINPDYFSAKMTEYAKEYGIKMRLHDIRHAFITYQLKRQTRISVVQELAGHQSAAVTLGTYGHVLKHEKEEAIASSPFNIKTAK